MDPFISMENQFGPLVYGGRDIRFTHGKGAILYAADGSEYLDFVQGHGVGNLGHSHPKIIQAIKDQAEKFKIEQKSLDDRAKEAMTFDETFKATIESLKSALLPLLQKINTVLLPKLSKIADSVAKFGDSSSGWIKVAAALITAGGLLKASSFIFQKSIDNWTKTGSLLGKDKGAPTTKLGTFLRGSAKATGAGGGGAAPATFGQSAGAGLKGLGKGAGMGAAGAGVGAGIMIAAKGLGELAAQMAKLDKTQIWALPATMLAMAGAFWAFTPAITAAAGASTAGAVGLLALGAAVVGIGFGINLATKGIGKMAEGLGIMFEKTKGAGKDMLMIAGSIAAIAGSLALFSNPLSALGMTAFAGVMGTVVAASLATALVAKNIEKMGTAMKGSKEDWVAVQNAVQAISKGNIKGGGIFGELAKLLKQPLKVEFTKGTVSMINDITLQIDKTTFMHKVYDPKIAIQMHENLKTGYGS